MMHDQGATGWLWGLGFGHGWLGILILVLVIVGIAALLKYLFGDR